MTFVTPAAIRAGRWSSTSAPGGGCSSRADASVDVADDPALPGLRAALAAGAEIVRYHPHLRCTVRLGERYGKVLGRRLGPALLAAQRELWAHRDELGFAVAEPLSYDEATRTVWLGAVRGEPVVEPTAELAERMGAALATLARSAIARPRIVGERQGAAPGRRRRSSRPSPRCGARSRRCSRAIAALHEAAADVPLRPTHGAPHPTAWLLDGERLGLVDFDRLGLGHPERDVAAFAAGAPAVADAFARGFGELDAARLEAYRLERGLAKALRATL